MPDWLKWTGAVATWIGGALLFSAPHTIAHQVGAVLVAIGAGSGVVSRGTERKPGGVPP